MARPHESVAVEKRNEQCADLGKIDLGANRIRVLEGLDNLSQLEELCLLPCRCKNKQGSNYEIYPDSSNQVSGSQAFKLELIHCRHDVNTWIFVRLA